MDQLRQIEAFNAVAQHGSFVKAADRLELSKAVVSRLVLELEARLGTRLLNRTTRRLSLTDSGRPTTSAASRSWTTWPRPMQRPAPPQPAPRASCASTPP